MSSTADSARDFLRHTLATLAYRGAKALRGAPAGFEDFRAGEGGRSAGEILAHLGDLLDWSFVLVRGEHTWKAAPVLPWDEGTRRFLDGLERLDDELRDAPSLDCAPEQLFQGPIADALTHVGQIALLRRLAGAPVRGENYFLAEIAAGRVGSDQASPVREFD